LPTLLNAGFKVAISLGAILAVIQIARAGLMYTGFLSYFEQIGTDKSKAKRVLNDAIFGLVLLLAVWIVLYTINPDLLNLDVLRSVRGNAVSGGAAASPSTPASPQGIAGSGNLSSEYKYFFNDASGIQQNYTTLEACQQGRQVIVSAGGSAYDCQQR
jgi:hypothetical protein